MANLGTLGGGGSEAFGINDLGQVVGWALREDNVLFHAFLWDNGVMTDVGALGGLSSSRAEAINICGQVVGNGAREILGENGTEAIDYPFLYDSRAGMWNLHDLLPPDSGWSELRPLEINDLGQIVGAGTIQRRRHAFVMTPLTNPTDDADGDGVPDCLDSCSGADDEVFGPCDPDEIPTISDWGLVILALMLLAAAKVRFGRRSPT